MTSLTRNKTAPTAMFLLLLAGFCCAPQIVKAEADCYRYAGNIVRRPAHSLRTVQAWSKWNQEHPSYHPPLHRPDYQRALNNFKISCAIVPPIDAPLDFTIEAQPLPLLAFDETLYHSDKLALPSHLPSTFSPLETDNLGPTPSSITPEPSSLLMLATAVTVLLVSFTSHTSTKNMTKG